MSKEKPIVYAFIDSQNLNLGIQSRGWKLDFKKFRSYLRKEYDVSKAYLFIGQVGDNESMYQTFREAGYKVIFKPTTEFTKDGDVTVKGNVDAELVLYCSAILFNEYDKAIIVSGDGDFYCLEEFLENKHKLLHILVPNYQYSKLLKRFSDYVVRIDLLKYRLAYKNHKTSPDDQSKT